MSLTANPLQNMTSAHGDISSMKTYQNFNGTVVASTTESYANPANYLVNNATNTAFITNLFANHGLAGSACTAIIFSNGEHEIWLTKDPVPASGLPSGTTRFVKAAFDGNENISSGSLASP